MKKQALVLCSGGPDGAVTAAMLKAQGYDCELLFINYGQRGLHQELRSVIALSSDMGMPSMQVDIPGIYRQFESIAMLANYTKEKDMKDMVAYVPMRNLLFLSIACTIASSSKKNYVAIGNIKGGRYWDNAAEFTTAMDNMLRLACRDGIYLRVLAPCVELTKAEVLGKGLQLKVQFEHTWSCYSGNDLHCGECASCIGRRKAFLELGVADPVQYAKP